MLKFYRDAVREWRWSVVSRNGRILADSAEGYKNKADCKRGARLVWDILRSEHVATR